MEKRNKRPSILEYLSRPIDDLPEKDNKYFIRPYEDLNKDYDSGARVTEVPSSILPPNVLGMYHPVSHTIYIASNLPEYEKQWVRKHESGHAQGMVDEPKTDAYASSRVGYNPFPFRT